MNTSGDVVGESPGKRLTALVVYDDEEVMTAFCDMLEYLGFATFAVNGAEAALNMLSSEQRFDLILTHVRMPGAMGGAALPAAVRQLRPEMMMVVVTGHDGGSLAHLPPDTARLSKPFMIADLETQIAKLRASSG